MIKRAEIICLRNEEEKKNSYRMSTGKSPFGRLRCRWEYNIKADIQEIGYKVRIRFM
jgi:hypothetical protein